MEEITTFDKIAPYLTNPLVLVGFVLFLIFSLYKALIQSGIIPPIGPRIGGRLVQSILRRGFILALVVSGLGFALQFQQTPPEESSTESKHIQGGIHAGGDIKNTQINIQTAPVDTTIPKSCPDTDILVQGGVAVGGNIENSHIDISTSDAMSKNTDDLTGQ